MQKNIGSSVAGGSRNRKICARFLRDVTVACAKGRATKPAEKRRRNRRDCKLGLSDRIPLSKLSSKQFEIEIETEPTLRNRLNWVHISEEKKCLDPKYQIWLWEIHEYSHDFLVDL